MNWPRILKYIAILFVATAIAVIPFSFIAASAAAAGNAAPSWLSLGQLMASQLATILVFVYLARGAIDHVWPTAWSVVLGTWLISYVPNVVFLGQSFSEWVTGVLYIVISAAVGTVIAQRLGH